MGVVRGRRDERAEVRVERSGAEKERDSRRLN